MSVIPETMDVAVVGGGPAGLMAAETLSAAGVAVTVYERMPSVGRKFLIAGRGGLNLTHSEAPDAFAARYGPAAGRLRPMLEAFPPAALVAWAEGLGQPTFVGTSGRVFPRAFKASPLLRAWMARLEAQGVTIRTRTAWRGWTADGALAFEGPEGGVERARPDAVVLALGGASWPRLGSDGGWVEILRVRGVEVSPLRPANSGFDVAWSSVFAERFAGEPLKGVTLAFEGVRVKGEAMVSRRGLEGGAVYALSAALRDAIERDGRAVLAVDLKPDIPIQRLAERLSHRRQGDSVGNTLRKAGLSPVAAGLLREARGGPLPANAKALAALVKAAPVVLTGAAPLDRAISTAGGVAFDAVDETLQLRAVPRTWVAGEMIDWEAPTGGYLLQACFATGVGAARAILAELGAGEG